MRKQSYLAVLLASAVTLGSSSAWALGVDVFGVGTYSMATGTPEPVSRMGLPGGGLRLNFRLGARAEFQLAGMFLTTVINDGTADQTMTAIRGTGGFGFILTRGLKFNLGGYYSNISTNPMGLIGSDYGAYAGLGIHIPLGGTTSLLIEPQYHYALSSQVYVSGLTAGTLTPHQLVGLVGLSFGMGK